MGQTSEAGGVSLVKSGTVAPPTQPAANDSSVKDPAMTSADNDSVSDEDLGRLVEKAVENVMSDIKRYDPKAYDAIQVKVSEGAGKVVDVDALNSVSVRKHFNEAPADTSMPKVQKKDLQIKGDVYDQCHWKK